MRRLFRLSKSELFLLTEAVILVAAVRGGLWVLRYDQVRRALHRERGKPRTEPSRATIAQFVSAAGRLIPKANCLTRALATEALLRSNGYDACLRIGVSKDAADRLLAHAWVESDGNVVIGGDAMEGLTMLRPTDA